MNFACECGTNLLLAGSQYPQATSCPRCGREYCVLDDGSTIDANMPPNLGGSTGITAELPTSIDCVAADLKWERDRVRYSLIPFLNVLVPSRVVAVAVAILFLDVAIILLAEATSPANPGPYALGAVGAFLGAVIFLKAVNYQRAEREWIAATRTQRAPSPRPMWHSGLLWIAILLFAFIAIDLGRGGVTWVGSRDLQITFRVLDDDTLQYKELKNHLHNLIATLPEDQRLIFTLHREEGLTYQQIADRLDISIKTVEKKMSLALKHLRLGLKDTFIVMLLVACQ